jgi:hypothetical protein
METKYKIYTENFSGNLHAAARIINEFGWAEYLITVNSNGHNTVAVFKMPAKLVDELNSRNRDRAGGDKRKAIEEDEEDYRRDFSGT